MSQFLVSERAGGNLKLALADGGELPIQPAPGGNSGAVLVSVPNIAALAALSALGMPLGSIAYVQTVRAYWSLQAGAGTPDGITEVTAVDSSGRAVYWERFASGMIVDAQAQLAWTINPAAGSDENSGAVGHALKTFAEIVRRMGTSAPLLTGAVTITWLGDAPSSDPYTLVPSFGPAGSLTLQGTLLPQATATIGTFTARSNAAGTKNTITASGAPAGFWATLVGMTVHDTTAGAQFFVDQDLGTATAAISEPVALPVTALPTLATLANGDALTISRPSVVFANNLAAIGAGVTVQQLSVNSVSVSTDITQFTVCLECAFVGFVVSCMAAFEVAVVFSSCYFGNATSFEGSGGSFAAGSPFNTSGGFLGGDTTLDGYVLVNQVQQVAGDVLIGAAFFGEGAFPTGGSGQGESQPHIVASTFDFGVCALIGPATIAIDQGTQFNGSGITAAASLLCTGGLSIDGAATGFTFNTTTGAFSAGASALTPANLDTNKSYQQPRTGTRMYLV